MNKKNPSHFIWYAFFLFLPKPTLHCFVLFFVCLSEISRDVVYFSDAWISRIKPDVGDNWRLKVNMTYS